MKLLGYLIKKIQLHLICSYVHKSAGIMQVMWVSASHSELKFFKMHPLLKPYNLFYSNGVAILSGFHDISQNISVRFTDVIN